jgi:hypothetical protein
MNISEKPTTQLNLHVEDGAPAILCKDEILFMSLHELLNTGWLSDCLNKIP